MEMEMEMEKILSKIFGEGNVRREIYPDRGVILLHIGEDEDGLIAAYYTENDEGEPVAHLENIISFAPGNGTRLMNSFINCCREEGYAAIEAVVFPLYDDPRFCQYQRILRWYEKLGFVYEDEGSREEILAQPGELRLVKYEKELRHPRVVLRLNETETG